MRVRTIAGIAGGTAVLMCATVLPAAANNVDFVVGPHHGIWRDATDQLGACLGGTGTYYQAVVTIRPADGVGPKFSLTDYTVGDGCKYTGNLSIPEDERYVMTLTAYNHQTGSVSEYTYFYT
jgi:hypothetical protein